MALKKSELYASLWKSCDELRGGMDASQYKDYVLVLLFVKYVSDKASSQSNYLLDVPAGASFTDMVGLRGDKDIGEKINKIIHRLAEANDLTGVINVADFNDPEKLGRGKEMVDRLSNLIGIFNSPALDFRSNRAEGDDLLGDAYEYLMRHFATESGKSKGQFYTPAEVSRILAKVVGMGTARSAGQTVYDPTCGSGSLLLKAHDEALSATGFDLAIYGQEMDVATAALARMNMILHDAPTAEITPGGYSTLANPQFRNRDGSLKTFDFVVANPPFSNKAWRNGFDPANDEFGRFSAPYVLPPAKNGDFAFLLHIVASLKSTGKGAVILPHGVLFRGNAEAIIRREIVRRGYVKGIIGLPANLFYGTGIPACIVVVDKEGAASRDGIFMIDASRGYRKDGNKNRLREEDLHRIVDVFARQIAIEKYSRFVPIAEIEEQSFNLNMVRYIDSSPAADVQNVQAHLRGGIPARDVDALEKYWSVFPSLRHELFGASDDPEFVQIRMQPADVRAAVFKHPEFGAFRDAIHTALADWESKARRALCDFGLGGRPKNLIEELSESLLTSFQAVPLVSAYDVFQRLMDYWAEAFQDDAYLIAEAGWVDAAKPAFVGPGRVPKDGAEFVVSKQRFKSDLLPADILIARYFAAEREEIAEQGRRLSLIEAEITELVEEHRGEGGALEDVVDENGKIAKPAVVAALKSISPEAGDETEILRTSLRLLDAFARSKDELRSLQSALFTRIAAQYGELSESDVQSLVIDGKWLARARQEVTAQVHVISTAFAGRIAELARRYAVPLPEIEAGSQALSERVAGHLAGLGFRWK